ncbi:MAG: hypothetical protein Q9219_005144 [cf. Caloplaca sp. 3 TL-2023]
MSMFSDPSNVQYPSGPSRLASQAPYAGPYDYHKWRETSPRFLRRAPIAFSNNQREPDLFEAQRRAFILPEDNTLVNIDPGIDEVISDDDFTFDCSESEAGQKRSEDNSSHTSPKMEHPVVVTDKKLENSGLLNSTHLSVWQSSFVGDDTDRSEYTAHLSVSHPPPSSKKSKDHLFEWMYVPMPSFYDRLLMSLAIFKRSIRIFLLSRVESEQAVALIHRLREKCEHPIPTAGAAKGHYMDSGLFTRQNPLQYLDGEDAGQIYFLCLPYFSLEPYSSRQDISTSDAHPMRSLLSIQYPSVAREREMQQAFCRLKGSGQRLCYHVPQLWCLAIGKKLLLTYSRLSMQQNQQSIGNVDTLDPPLDSFETCKIHINDSNGRLWLLPLSRCLTWLDFTAQFSTLTLDFTSDYYITHDEHLQEPEDWQNLVDLAKKQTLFLTLHSQR